MKVSTRFAAMALVGMLAYRLGARSVSSQTASAAPPDGRDGRDGEEREDDAPLPSLGDATLNEGEQLQDVELAGVGLRRPGQGTHEDLLAPQTADEAASGEIRPGLPDFARGA